jgi:hypothetical protein
VQGDIGVGDTAGIKGTGQVAKQTRQSAFFARVRVRVEPNGSGEVSANGVSPADVWPGWRSAAVAGARFALRTSAPDHDCSIDEIQGITCDTNATLVAIAAARAVWDALGTVPAEEAGILDDLVEKSHRVFRPDEVAPVFDSE